MYVDNDSRGYITINEMSTEDAKRLCDIIRQADKQLLPRPIEVLEKQLHTQLNEVASLMINKKP